jgi:beta-N-acetylhexosaminidase/D-alanyl-D-alanine dipeptidase
MMAAPMTPRSRIHPRALRSTALLCALVAGFGVAPWAAAEAPADLVDLHAVDPTIRLDIRYATGDNFAGEAVYPVARCLLRRPVAEALARAQEGLRERGLGLLVWDCYRPFRVQQRFWELVPDERYVARPAADAEGRPVEGSRHNRGAAVDLTLVDGEGRELAMPTGYDDFSTRAYRTSLDAAPQQRANSLLLEEVLAAEGFTPLATEWWHFDGPGWPAYGLLDVPLDAPPPGS